MRPAWYSLLLSASSLFAGAQRTAQPPSSALRVTSTVPSSIAVVLLDLASRAGVIFTGTVLTVTHNDDRGFVDIAFRIEQALKGCPRTGTYVLREWEGLWASGGSRYRAGEHLLLLLAARGPSGLSAPVGGMAGVIPLIPTRQPPLLHGSNVAPPQIPAETANAGESLAADLRWVQILGLRSLVSLTPGSRLSRVADDPAQPLTLDSSWRGAVLTFPPAVSATELPSLPAVLALLGQGNRLPVAIHEGH